MLLDPGLAALLHRIAAALSKSLRAAALRSSLSAGIPCGQTRLSGGVARNGPSMSSSSSQAQRRGGLIGGTAPEVVCLDVGYGPCRTANLDNLTRLGKRGNLPRPGCLSTSNGSLNPGHGGKHIATCRHWVGTTRSRSWQPLNAVLVDGDEDNTCGCPTRRLGRKPNTAQHSSTNLLTKRRANAVCLNSFVTEVDNTDPIPADNESQLSVTGLRFVVTQH